MNPLKKYFNNYSLIILINFLFYIPLFRSGMIIFSDISVGYDTQRYMEEIFGLWNQRYNTTTMLNLPRLFIVLPSYLLSLILGAEWLTKSLVIVMSIISSIGQYHFSRYLSETYLFEKNNNKNVSIACLFAALFYAFNPWFLVRIQHTYLLCGYALFPFIIHYYLKIFNTKYKDNGEYRVDYCILATLISLASAAIHYFFFAIIAISILIFTGLIKKLKTHSNEKARTLVTEFKKSLLLGCSSLLACSYWLIPYLYATATGKLTKQANINVEETLDMFSRHSSLWNVLTNNSYWWPMTPGNTPPDTANLGWVLILSLVCLGAVVYSKRNDLIKLFVLISAALILFSTGTFYPK
ncbi:MAG: hypothetical protein MJK18_16005, partial [Bdellovibrionales bacterium]|nr:hypothetical protein [Bdellovibrionales bacterium]